MSDPTWRWKQIRQAQCLAVLLVLLVGSTTASAQEPLYAGVRDPEKAEDPRPLAKGLAKDILLDQKAIWTSPCHIARKDIKLWLTFGAITGVAVATDGRTSRQLPNTPDQLAISSHVSQIGAAYTVIPLAGALYLTGLLAKDSKLRGTGLLAGEALADALIVSEVIKVATRRQRPLDGDGGGHFFHGGDSFPSGHVIESFAFASVVAHRYRNKKAVVIIAYGLAGLVSASRFTTRKHFASDIVAGGFMGWFIGKHVYARQ